MAHSHSRKKIKTRTNLPSLEVPAALEDGLIPLDRYEEDLLVRIPHFAEMKESDILNLYDGVTSLIMTYTLKKGEAEDPDFNAELFIPKGRFPPAGGFTELSLDYEIIDPVTDDGERSGKTVTVVFDRESPGGTSLTALSFTEAQKEGITEEDLLDGYLPVTAYAWYGMEKGDFITPWLSELPASADSQELYLIKNAEIEISTAGTRTSLGFPKGSFTAAADYYFGYQVRDKLGNTSVISSTVKIAVNVGSLIKNHSSSRV